MLHSSVLKSLNLLSMKSKNLIVFFLTSLFMMNLMAAQSGALLQVLSGKKVTVVHPFCKKPKSNSKTCNSIKSDNTAVDSFQIQAICTTVFDFKTASFLFIAVEDNFKDYAFSESLYSNLFAERLEIPPRV